MPGASRPGPTCDTRRDSIDRGTNCLQPTPAPRPVGMHQSASPTKRVDLQFSELWAAYPADKPYVDTKTGQVPKGYENQCAIKVSVALHAVGVDLRPFKGASVDARGVRAAVRAQELSAWLRRQPIRGLPASPENVTGKDWQDKIKGRSGIVYFADYWARAGESAARPSGDHIDLWNGSRLTASGLEGAAVTFLRFTLGVESGPGFSDLGKARLILFWEVK